MRRITGFPMLLAVGLACCTNNALVGTGFDGGTLTSISLTPNNQIDLLFMIDNSPSMSPKQAELQARFPELMKVLDDYGQTNPAHYHIGVVTSDMGAGQFNIGGGQCHPGGDGGRLQAIGRAAQASCVAPTGGFNFIDYNQIDGSNNLPMGQDLPTTFTCMASVGAAGCGFEAQLESVYAALHNPPAENAGFLRDDALLVVFFLTDEDDCSAPPETDLFDPAAMQYGALLSYRCTNYSIACGHPPMLMPYGSSNGNLNADDSCADADPSVNKLFPVGRYIDFFTQPSSMGGVKSDPGQVFLVDISAPTDDVESLLANPSQATPGPFAQCPGPISNQCAVVLQHSCIASTSNMFFGDPAVRVRQVVNAVGAHQSTSICDTNYTPPMQSMGGSIISLIEGNGCLPAPPANPSAPICHVSDNTASSDGTTSTTELPQCSDTQSPPCWRIRSSSVCASQLSLAVDRGGVTPAPDTQTLATCILAAD